MKVTIKDIAQVADVSVSAVSLALNNKPGVSDATRRRILETAEELGYTAISRHEQSTSANVVRVLKIQRHGHTMNSSHNFFIDAYVDGINEIASLKGIKLEIGTYGMETPISELTERMIKAKPIIGYLILGTELSENDVLALVQTGMNIVFMDTFLDYVPADFVDMNNTDAVYKIITYLIDHGHRKIGMIKSSVPTRNFVLREQAFSQVAGSLNLHIDEEQIIDVDSTFEGAYTDMKGYLRNHTNLPTAFFAINDIIALGCMKALQEAGYDIPEDVSVIAFDNLPMASMVSPPLTSMDVSQHRIGQNALTMLLSKSGHNESTPPDEDDDRRCAHRTG